MANKPSKTEIEVSIEASADITVTGTVRVLLVDDDAGFFKVASQLLEMQGDFQVETARNVSEALEKLEKGSYDAVASDYQMPGKNGLEFLEELRLKGNGIPFVLFTGKGREEVAAKALNLGADQYVDKHGGPEAVYCELAHAIRQAVDRKSAQIESLKREAKLDAILESSPEAITVIDLNGTIIDCNQATLDVHGYTSKSEVIGQHSFNLVSEKDHKRALEDMKRTLEQGSTKNIEYTATKKDGSEFHVEISGSVIRDPSGNLIGFVSITKDITERKRTEREIRIKDAALASSIGAVAFADLEGNLTYVNSSFLRMWGYANDKEVLGRPAGEFWLAEEKTDEIVKAVNDEGGWVGELAAKKKDGSTFEAQLSASLVNDETRKPLCMMGSFLDITERRKAGQSLKESEEKYRGLVELAPDGIVAVNAEGIVTSANRSFLTLVGYDSEEGIIGKQFTELMTMRMEDIPRFQRMFMSLMKGESPSPSEFLYVRRDGTSRWAEVHPGLLIKDGNPVGAQAIMRDVTERKNAEKLIQDNQQKFEQLFMSSPEAAAYVDPNERVLNVNPRFTELFGYSFDEIKEKFLDDFVVPEDRRKEALMLAQKGRRRYVYYETVRKNKEGSLIPVTLSSAPIVLQGQHMGDVVLYKDITERKKAEEALRETRNYLDNLLNYANAPVIVWGNEQKISLFNNAFEALTGYKKESVLGRNIDVLFPPLQKTEILQTIERATRGEKWQSVEVPILCKDEETRTVLWNSANVTNKDGNIVATIAQGQDITERRKIEDELRRFSTAVRASLDGIITGDLNGNISDVNDAVLTMYGSTSKGDLIGRNVLDFLVERDRTRALQDSLESMKTGQGKTVEYTAITKDGTEIPIEITTAFMRDEQGEPTEFVDIVRNITERKKAEELVRASEKRYKFYIEVTGQLGWTTNANGEVEEDIPAWRKYTGQSHEEVKGLGWTKALHPDDLEHTAQAWEKAVAAKSPYEVEYRVRKYDGVYRYFLAHGVPVFDEDGSVREWVGTCVDITERKKAEEKLKESEKKFKLIFEGARDGILAADAKTEKFVFANPRICEMTGYSEKELLRLGVKNIHPKKDLSYVMDTFAKQLQRKIEIGRDMPVLRKDRNVVYCDVNSYLLEVGERKLLVGLFRDVTERKSAEKVIIESQQKFEALFRNNPEAAVYLDLDFRILDMNPRFCQLFGYSAKEVEGKQINEVVTPEDMIEEAERLDKDAKKGYASLDTVRKRKDGSLVHVSISAAPVTIEGKLLSYVEVYKDITDMKDTEERLKEMNKRLEATNEKLHVVGGLTRHDVRNKLSAVTGNAYLLRRKLAEDPKALEQLNDMEAAVRLVEKIFEFARAYEKLGVEQLTSMDVGQTVDGAVSLFSDLKGIKIVNECDGLTVLADSLLTQLVYNLIDNSLKHGEKIQQIKIHYGTPSADQLELVYEDDGVGIHDNMRSNLFKEGFTSGKGAGYGLFMIKRMCEVYGWTIRETGKQGKGAQFTMSIPRIGSTGKANYQIQNPRQH